MAAQQAYVPLTPYQLGLLARELIRSEPNPRTPFTPGSAEYCEYAKGFCHEPFPDLVTDKSQPRRVEKRSTLDAKTTTT